MYLVICLVDEERLGASLILSDCLFVCSLVFFVIFLKSTANYEDQGTYTACVYQAVRIWKLRGKN